MRSSCSRKAHAVWALLPGRLDAVGIPSAHRHETGWPMVHPEVHGQKSAAYAWVLNVDADHPTMGLVRQDALHEPYFAWQTFWYQQHSTGEGPAQDRERAVMVDCGRAWQLFRMQSEP